MKTRHPTFAALAVACLAVLPVAQAGAANLLSNGSFEAPDVPSGNTFYPSGSGAITGWTTVGAGEMQLSDHPTCTDGFQCIDLTGIYGYDKGLRSDAVPTALGTAYVLSFDLGNVVQAGFGSSTVAVSINGGAATWFTNVIHADPSGFEWERQAMTWVADASSAQITILGVANGSLSNDAGILLDKVDFSAAPVPEPGSAAMLLAGFALVGGVARRRLQRS